jgi:hypothetical protein
MTNKNEASTFDKYKKILNATDDSDEFDDQSQNMSSSDALKESNSSKEFDNNNEIVKHDMSKIEEEDEDE